MVKKLLYTIFSIFRISLRLNNPLVMISYLFKKTVQLNFKNGLILQTNQILDAVIIKETIIDDDYRVSAIKDPVKKIIDIGAGLGDFTLLVAKKFPLASVIAFEPNPEQFKLLKENIRQNNIKNVKSYPIAIGTKKSYLLHLFSFNVHSSTVKTNKSKKVIKVNGIRLDKFINGTVDLLKIDCEGAEIDILKSISDNKMGLVKRIIIEYHNNIIQNEDKKILTILNKWKYKLEVEKNLLIPETGYIFATKKSFGR